jgi:quinol monooxygenase YgiN
MTYTAVLVEAEIKPEAAEEIKAMLTKARLETLNFSGCQSVDIYQDRQQPGSIVLYEHWDSADDHQKYLEWREETGAFVPLASALTKPFTVRYFDRVNDHVGIDR